jgi:hypothetical protein
MLGGAKCSIAYVMDDCVQVLSLVREVPLVRLPLSAVADRL